LDPGTEKGKAGLLLAQRFGFEIVRETNLWQTYFLLLEFQNELTKNTIFVFLHHLHIAFRQVLFKCDHIYF